MYEDEAQVQEVVVKAVERNVVQEDWESEEEVVLQLLEAQEALEVQEAQEVQDHHSHHLPPDLAALANPAHSQEVEGHWGRPLTLQERPHCREGGQRH